MNENEDVLSSNLPADSLSLLAACCFLTLSSFTLTTAAPSSTAKPWALPPLTPSSAQPLAEGPSRGGAEIFAWPPWQKQGDIAEVQWEASTPAGSTAEPRAVNLPLSPASPGTGARAGLQAGQIGVAFLQSEALEGLFGCNISYDFVLRVTF